MLLQDVMVRLVEDIITKLLVRKQPLLVVLETLQHGGVVLLVVVQTVQTLTGHTLVVDIITAQVMQVSLLVVNLIVRAHTQQFLDQIPTLQMVMVLSI